MQTLRKLSDNILSALAPLIETRLQVGHDELAVVSLVHLSLRCADHRL